ncbi:hypothetical protein ACGFMK_38825, partial [Amycolatopsis sp. NPDC049252]|uniref:hypothetical protein n=1 Tax=Amycolatopsis sp. NPDC049252 TaxID=3363933 RepID=UPI003711854D
GGGRDGGAHDGWGDVDAPGFDDPVWVHFSVIDPASRGVGPGGFRQLTVGAEVEFTVERAEQDGFHWRAVWITE